MRIKRHITRLSVSKAGGDNSEAVPIMQVLEKQEALIL